jgi:anti-sigma B factor antagonist
MNFSVTIRQSDDISVVELKGHLTSFELGAMREAIQGLLKQGRTNILLNLSGLQYLDSSGVGELVRNYMSVVKRGEVEEILKITKLYQVFQEFPDEQTARESFPASRSSTLP